MTGSLDKGLEEPPREPPTPPTPSHPPTPHEKRSPDPFRGPKASEYYQQYSDDGITASHSLGKFALIVVIDGRVLRQYGGEGGRGNPAG
jgi:hypothetical protein